MKIIDPHWKVKKKTLDGYLEGHGEHEMELFI